MADFGYLLNQRYWGHRYATESARALVRWLMTVAP
ncbi:MAG: hypothetical protein ICV78_26815 [Tolypothrix sp. Co-bin9]|nr:hypothetical protein [Tolypothrix sp. Co-bin9]